MAEAEERSSGQRYGESTEQCRRRLACAEPGGPGRRQRQRRALAAAWPGCSAALLLCRFSPSNHRQCSLAITMTEGSTRCLPAFLWRSPQVSRAGGPRESHPGRGLAWAEGLPGLARNHRVKPPVLLVPSGSSEVAPAPTLGGGKPGPGRSWAAAGAAGCMRQGVRMRRRALLLGSRRSPLCPPP